MIDASAAEAVFVPRGRPVARFVAAIGLLGAALAVVWVTGVANPRLELSLEGWEGNADDGRGVLVVRNQGLTAARVRVVRVGDEFVRLARPVSELRVGANQTRRVAFHFVVDCAAHDRATRNSVGAPDPALPLVVQARGPLGVTNEFTSPYGAGASLGAACRPSG